MDVGEIYAVKSCQVSSQVHVHVLMVADGSRRDAVKSCQVSSQVHVHVLKVAGEGWRDAVKSCKVSSQVHVHVLNVAGGVGEIWSSPARCVCTC